MKNLIAIVVAFVLVVFGYFYFINNRKVILPVKTSSEKNISIKLDAVNNSGESGLATFTTEGSKTKVSLNLTGSPKDVVQPAHIHIGGCPGVGAVKYPLTFPVNGLSETTLDVSLDQLVSELPLAINVHKSGIEAGSYVSCGNITR